MKVFARRQRSNTAMLTTSTAIFPSTLITGIPTIYSRHTLGCMGDALAAAPVQTLRTRETLGDCPVLALGRAAAWPRIRSQTSYIFEVDT